MNLDSPKEQESTPMNVDDDAVSCHHPPHRDTAEMNSPGSSSGEIPPSSHPQEHQFVGSVQTSFQSLPSRPPPGCEPLLRSDTSPQLMVSRSPSSPVVRPGGMGDVHQARGLARQRRGFDSESSVGEVTPRKQKRTYGSTDMCIGEDDNAFTDDTESQSRRRVRPRPRTQQGREFTPLLFLSPPQERNSPAEETISAFHHPQNVTDPSQSIQRFFHPGNLLVHHPCTPQNDFLPKVSDLEDCRERRRSGSTDSFAEVALACTVTPKHGRLSTLQDFWLPRPFEETNQPSVGIVKVHERGLEEGPSFSLTNTGRTGGLWSSRERVIHMSSSRSPILPYEPSPINFFGKPICDSPDSISPSDEDEITRF